MSKIKDLVIGHNADIRKLQKDTLDRIELATRTFHNLPDMKAEIQEALDMLHRLQVESEERFSEQLKRLTDED